MGSKLRDQSPIRLVGKEQVEIELQHTPLVRVRVGITEYRKRGWVIEIVGLDSTLEILPLTANQILIDSR
jgi:hypothetical protein